jgi:AcrR family transcriptional regulator
MSGLRERKKQQTREQILAAATRLFTERGLTAPTMEEIAAAGGVSVATLYNYFGSKTALQLGLLSDETELMFEAGGRVVAEPGDDPAAAVVALFEAYRRILGDLDRRLLRDAFRAGMTEPDLTAGLVGLDLRLMGQLTELLRVLAARGDLDPSITIEDAGLLLYSVFATQLIFYLTVEAMETGHLAAQIRTLVEVAFRGLGNERER